ncbi:hypothetical protein KAR34_02420 [bacterium]|nr:hypothetical protein [bacterium]
MQTILAGGLALVVGKTTGCKAKQPVPQAENPYAYNIDQFKKVKPSRITHQELNPILFQDALPKCVTLTKDDVLLVATDKKLHIFNSDKTASASFALKQQPHSLAALTSEAIYVAYQDHIEVYTYKGKLKQTWNTLGEKAFITGMAANTSHVVVADYGHKQLWLFDTQGRLKRFIGLKSGHRHAEGFKIPSPYFDVNFGANGTIWAVNPGLHRLENYALDGTLKSYWGKPGMNLDGFAGCCNPTHFTLLPNGQFITVEKGLVRIKVYTKTGAFSSVVAPPDAFQEGLTGVGLATDSQGRIYVVDRFKKQVRIFVKK